MLIDLKNFKVKVNNYKSSTVYDVVNHNICQYLSD